MAPLKLSILFSFLLLSLLHVPSMAHSRTKNQSPFDFINHLKGCHKGEKVKGIHDLKNYLKHFGYLKYSKNQNHSNDDDFDDFLESAVKKYQENYHLNVTGDLDSKTVSKMTESRCGVPDIINGTNWMKMRNGKKGHRHLLNIHTVSHYSFFQGNPRWPSSKTHLTYAFYPNTSPQVVSPVARAFNNWAAATHFRFSQVQNFNGADIKIGFFKGNHQDGHSFDGRGGVLAHAFAPTDGRFHYDADELWSVGPLPGYMDVETVALHEIGHLLGLGHSSVEGAIMWPSITSGVTKRLHADDIQGIKALYNV
ncbi:hypothetical protein M9H77_09335 [Catharanthus roseus]|uniref:Uncharacterized protein n=1 Tax=Catharanthus roseus TaxID=4058 RepID=A0ACC0C0F8_CATRO|nr:hypothetical protein M9H77_09335 [Catharanthus roseus]